jgi:adenine phosphoribosyltransferase
MSARAEGLVAELRDTIRDVADFPRPGVVFKDITPLLGDAAAFGACIDAIAERFAASGVDKVIGIEARGFIVAAPVANRLRAGFVPVRKAGKLPWRVETEDYALEYGTDRLEVHVDAFSSGERVLIVDDVLATGGTAQATTRLVSRLGAIPVGFACIIELGFLGGRQRLCAGGDGKAGGLQTVSLITYE